jgi:hypothetical protein
MGGALKEGDSNIMFWGADAVDARNKNEIIDAAQKEIDRIKANVNVAKKAAGASFYNHIVKDGPAY